MNVVFDSWLQSLPYCYARVIQETCNTSSADINVLKTAIYNAELSSVIHHSCALGESQLFGHHSQHNTRGKSETTRGRIWKYVKWSNTI